MLGVDDVIIYCVNDGAVMEAWAINQGVSTTQLELNSNGKEEEDDDDDDDDDDSFSSSSIIHLFGDPYGEVTESLDMELTAAGPKMKGLVQRCKRFALYIVNGKVEIKRIAEADNDPAGDDYPDITLAESMIVAITEFNNKSSSGGGEEL
jgi:2-Cys peroxiredoxin 5